MPWAAATPGSRTTPASARTIVTGDSAVGRRLAGRSRSPSVTWTFAASVTVPKYSLRTGTSRPMICASLARSGFTRESLRVITAARAATRYLSWIGLATLAALLVAGCATRGDDHPTSPGTPSVLPGSVVTEQGRQAADLYLPIFIIAVIIFILVEGLLILVALRFRRKRGDAALPSQRHGNNTLEVLWTAIPAIVVLVLFVVSTSVLLKVDTVAAEPGGHGRRDRLPVAVDVRLQGPGPELHRRRQGRPGDGRARSTRPSTSGSTPRTSSTPSTCPSSSASSTSCPGRINEFQVKVVEEGHLRRSVRRVLWPLPLRHVLHGPRRRPGDLRPMGHR